MDHFQTWQGHLLPYDLGQVLSWRFCLIKYAHNGSFNEPASFDLPEVIFTRGQFWPSGIVIAPVCVSVSVCVCVCINHLLVRTITHQPLKLESPNLKHRCKTPWLRCLLFWGVIDLEIQGQIQLDSRILTHFELALTITCHPFKLESPNLDKKCILVQLRCLLI